MLRLPPGNLPRRRVCHLTLCETGNCLLADGWGEDHLATKEFRCADVGYTECDWWLQGNSEEEMLPQIEQHAFAVHHLELKDEAIEHVKKAISPVA